MTNLLKFFAIMKDTGVSLLEYKPEKRFDENLMGGFLSAIYRFGDESCSDDMSKVSLEGDNMRISSINYKYNENITLIAVGILSQIIDEQEFKEFAEKILNEFCEQYNEDLVEFSGEITKFRAFNEYLTKQIDEYFGNDTIKFEKELDDIFKKFAEGDLSGLEDLDSTFKKFVKEK